MGDSVGISFGPCDGKSLLAVCVCVCETELKGQSRGSQGSGRNDTSMFSSKMMSWRHIDGLRGGERFVSKHCSL